LEINLKQIIILINKYRKTVLNGNEIKARRKFILINIKQTENYGKLEKNSEGSFIS